MAPQYDSVKVEEVYVTDDTNSEKTGWTIRGGARSSSSEKNDRKGKGIGRNGFNGLEVRKKSMKTPQGNAEGRKEGGRLGATIMKNPGIKI